MTNKKDNKIPIYEKITDTNPRRKYRLRLRPSVKFSGFQMREKERAMVKTPMGGCIAQPWDWIIIFPDGGLYVISNKLYQKMFYDDLVMDAVGKKCFCGGIFGKVGPYIRCNKCGERLAGLDASEFYTQPKDINPQKDS